MDQVVRLRLSEDEKVLWVQAAHGELVTLSEWIRRACAARAGLARGEENVVEGSGQQPARAQATESAVSPRANSRPFRSDFKK